MFHLSAILLFFACRFTQFSFSHWFVDPQISFPSRIPIRKRLSGRQVNTRSLQDPEENPTSKSNIFNVGLATPYVSVTRLPSIE
uniref:Putative secreted protein n=1 Tax=Anopheles triannulatus TaxID=58253 RepID=A0A2M4B701_9DIPT